MRFHRTCSVCWRLSKLNSRWNSAWKGFATFTIRHTTGRAALHFRPLGSKQHKNCILGWGSAPLLRHLLEIVFVKIAELHCLEQSVLWIRFHLQFYRTPARELSLCWELAPGLGASQNFEKSPPVWGASQNFGKRLRLSLKQCNRRSNSTNPIWKERTNPRYDIHKLLIRTF